MPIAESLAVGKVIIEFLGKDRVWRWLHKLESPLLTVGLLGIIYAGYFVMREGSLIDGLNAAFLQSRAQMERTQIKEKEPITEDLIRAGIGQKMIMASLTRFLPTSPSAVRVRLGLLHTTGVGVGRGTEMLRYDIPYAVAVNGYSVGDFYFNSMVYGLDALFVKMNMGNFSCDQMTVDTLPNLQLKERLTSLDVRYMVTCPLRSAKGTLYGLLFIHYPRNLPSAEEIRIVEHEAAISAIEIGAALGVD